GHQPAKLHAKGFRLSAPRPSDDSVRRSGDLSRRVDRIPAGTHVGHNGSGSEFAALRLDSVGVGPHLPFGELWRSLHGQSSQSGSSALGAFSPQSPTPGGEIPDESLSGSR